MTEQELAFLELVEQSTKPLSSEFYNRIEQLRKLAEAKEKEHDVLL